MPTAASRSKRAETRGWEWRMSFQSQVRNNVLLAPKTVSRMAHPNGPNLPQMAFLAAQHSRGYTRLQGRHLMLAHTLLIALLAATNCAMDSISSSIPSHSRPRRLRRQQSEKKKCYGDVLDVKMVSNPCQVADLPSPPSPGEGHGYPFEAGGDGMISLPCRWRGREGVSSSLRRSESPVAMDPATGAVTKSGGGVASP